MGIICSIPCCLAGKAGKCVSAPEVEEEHESEEQESDASPPQLPGLDPAMYQGTEVYSEAPSSPDAKPWGTPKISPGKSFVELNKRFDDLLADEIEESRENARRSLQRLSAAARISIGCGTAGDDADKQDVDVEAVLDEVERLVDVSYDVLKAEELLAALEEHLGSNSKLWEDILERPFFDRFKRKLDIYTKVGQAVCKATDDWFCVYHDQSWTQTIYGCIDKDNNKCLHYRVTVHIPTSLTNVMAIGNEVELLPTWNTLVINEPSVIGRRTAHYMVLNYQMSILGGMYKVDILNEIRRFSDPEGGYLAEYIESAGNDHPCYKPTLNGYKRPDTKLQNIWIACGPKQTTLVQVGKVVLPFTATKWLASTVGSLAGRFIVGGLVKNSMRSAEPGNPWEERLAQDVYGLYERMSECVNGAGSGARSRRKTSMSATEMNEFFSNRSSRIKRSEK